MTIHQLIFSPTGGTKRVSDFISQGIGIESVVTELCVKASDLRLPEIKEDDLVIIAMPVFAGRVPAMAVERLRMAKPNNAKCAVVAVYGNRAFDDALLEMQDVATEMGFRVIAAVAAVAEHSIVRRYGNARPDADDEATLRQFGADILRKAADNDLKVPQVPGNRPYKNLAWCRTLKANVAATAAAFAQHNALPTPSRSTIPRPWTQPNASRA